MTAANTRDCWAELVGHRVVGVMFDAFPVQQVGLRRGNKALILDDGRALVVTSRGSYWIERADDVRRAVREKQTELRANIEELDAVLKLAGEPE